MTGGPASISLDYDPFGRLFKTTVGGTVTRFGYAGANLAAEYPSSGWNNPLRTYISGAGVDSWLMWFEGNGSGATVRWFEQDRLGSVISVSDAAGAVTPYTYGPYGEPQSWAGSRFRYTGQMAIPEAQLYHYRARAYDPVTGRFLQTDPIGYDDAANLYLYVSGDPLNAADPTGMARVTLSEVVTTGARTTPGEPSVSTGNTEIALVGRMSEREASEATEAINIADVTGIKKECEAASKKLDDNMSFVSAYTKENPFVWDDLETIEYLVDTQARAVDDAEFAAKVVTVAATIATMGSFAFEKFAAEEIGGALGAWLMKNQGLLTKGTAGAGAVASLFEVGAWMSGQGKLDALTARQTQLRLNCPSATNGG